MIISFKHKGLEQFYHHDWRQKINPAHAVKLRNTLNMLNAATGLHDINKSKYRLHRLNGKLKDYHAVSVDQNWRLIFIFTNKGVELIDYLDYH